MKPVEDGLHRMLQKYVRGGKHTLHVWPAGQPDPRIGGPHDPGPRQLREAGIEALGAAIVPTVARMWDRAMGGTLLDVPPPSPGNYRTLVQGGPKPFRLNAQAPVPLSQQAAPPQTFSPPGGARKGHWAGN